MKEPIKQGDTVERLVFVNDGGTTQELWLPCRVDRVVDDNQIEVTRLDSNEREALSFWDMGRGWRRK